MPVLSFVSSMIKPGDDIRVAVNWAIENEFHGVEISGSHFWPDLLEDEDIDWLTARAAEHGITYTIHFLLKAAPAAHHTERWLDWLDQMKRTIAMAGRIDCPVVVLHSGVIDCPGVEPKRATEALRRDAVDNLLRFLREVEPLARDADTVICLENMHHRQGDVTRSYQHLIDIVDAIDSPAVKITLDVGHAFIHDGLPAAIEAFGERIHHVHLDDALDGLGADEAALRRQDDDVMVAVQVAADDILAGHGWPATQHRVGAIKTGTAVVDVDKTSEWYRSLCGHVLRAMIEVARRSRGRLGGQPLGQAFDPAFVGVGAGV